MENSSNISLPREHCMSCREESDILMSSCTHFGIDFGYCGHKFCQSCFRAENKDFDVNSKIKYSCCSLLVPNKNHKFKCPCCHEPFYEHMQLDEAILISEAATLSIYLSPKLSPSVDAITAAENIVRVIEMNKLVIDKLETGLALNPSNLDIIYFLSLSCFAGLRFLAKNNFNDSHADFHRVKLFDYTYKLLDYSGLQERYRDIKIDCWHRLASTFRMYFNHPAAFSYSKIVYELCLRSPDHTNLSKYKSAFLQLRDLITKRPPLRFAVEDEVEFLHELETGSESEWKLGKVVELYYRERDFDVSFTAPYRLQVLGDSDSADQTPVYAWVKADADRYVRKVGVKSIEDTRYRARLDAKVADLALVYCSEKFIQDIYCALVQDQEFVEMLQSVWHIQLSEHMLSIYRMFVMYRQSLVRTDSGYHVPSSDEIIAGIRAYPTHLSCEAAPSAAGEDDHSGEIRTYILNMFRDVIPSKFTCSLGCVCGSDIQRHLLRGIRDYREALSSADSSVYTAEVLHQSSSLTVPLELSNAISKVSTTRDLKSMLVKGSFDTKLAHYIAALTALHACLENPGAGTSREFPFVYFFVKFCLDQGWGVPKLALDLYDRMNMQLSREFIRCANPTCELNRLDQSTGKIKFKKCSRCHAVIYCSRECQVAHYPEHKKLCREHLTGSKGP